MKENMSSSVYLEEEASMDQCMDRIVITDVDKTFTNSSERNSSGRNVDIRREQFQYPPIVNPHLSLQEPPKIPNISPVEQFRNSLTNDPRILKLGA